MVKKSCRENIYAMEKWVMSDENLENAKYHGVEPYHDGWWILATATKDGQIGDIREIHCIEEVVNALKPFSGKYKILLGRHPMFPEKMNVCGDVTKYCGIQINNYSNKLLKDSEIEYIVQN